jgi:hypothetical protein
MPAPFPGQSTLALDRSVASLADVGAVRGETRDARGGIEGLLRLLDGLQVAELVQELVQSDIVPSFPLELERTLQADADQELQIVCEAGDQRQ